MRTHRFRRSLPALAFIALISGAAGAPAQQPPLISRDVLFGNPERTSPRLSPDGTRLAWLAPDKKNVLQVWVKTVGKEDEKMVTADRKRGIRQYFWAKDDRTLLYQQDNDGDENFHVYGVDLVSGNVRDYTPFQGVRAGLASVNPDFPDEILVEMNLRNRELMDVHRLNLKTGGIVLDTENPGDVAGWDIDAKLQVRAATVTTGDGGTEIRIRDGAKSPWKPWIKVGPEEILVFVDFTADGKEAYLISSIGSDKARAVRRNLATGAETVLASSEVVDAQTLLVNPKTRALEAVLFAPGRAEWSVIDPAVKADFEGIRKLHDGDFNVVNRTTKDDIWLVAFTSDRGPMAFYRWDRTAKKGAFMFFSQQKLSGLVLSAMKPVVIKSRDGLDLHSYLTLPAGLPSKNLPMVLFVHGGPWGRDMWGYNPYSQWFANRGYACLQINYRASIGYGKRFLNAGNRQWGLKMHDDLIDGARWAVAEGYADPKRIAVFGGSYGGYAALAAATFTADFFACNVDIVGPSNLKTLIASIPPYWKPMRADFDHRMGNVDDPKDADLIRNASPLFKADRITKPLLIGQGANDPRVNVKESEQIVEAIEKNKGSVTYVLYPDEGHGFARPENRIDFNARAEQFLAGCLGGRFEPMDGEKFPGSTAVVKVVGGK
ncbi:MAG: S9 family peptidase [Thermoanaerobaculia bacterium]